MIIKRIWLKFILWVILFYLALGNLPRILPTKGFNNNLLITEGVIYIILLTYLFFNRGLILIIKPWLLLFLIIISSFLIGILKHGFLDQPCLYAVRLILILLTASTAGYVLFDFYRDNFVGAAKYILRIYIFLLLISTVIYLVFPDSILLWAYLSQYGIEYGGDPHQHRFISTYFDPNYYSTIACIPTLISLALFKATSEKKYLFSLLFFTVSIFLSGSRSGIATLILVGSFIFFTRGISTRFKKRNFHYFLIFLLIIFALLPIYLDNLLTTFGRLDSMGSDESSLARLDSFKYGLLLFKENIILGLGYNYLSYFTLKFNELSSVDSSLVSTLANFGLPLTCVLFGIFFFWIIYINNIFLPYKKLKHFIWDFLSRFEFYILLTIFFSSQFNNLIYYQFWLFPVVMIGTYLSKLNSYKSNLLNNNTALKEGLLNPSELSKPIS